MNEAICFEHEKILSEVSATLKAVIDNQNKVNSETTNRLENLSERVEKNTKFKYLFNGGVTVFLTIATLANVYIFTLFKELIK